MSAAVRRGREDRVRAGPADRAARRQRGNIERNGNGLRRGGFTRGLPQQARLPAAIAAQAAPASFV
jgi:hypothetical protein